eukprot:m.263896 g.263896  ORF g.263896 m.263896 type:complete len:1986 (-) comp15607_c0_seq3:334-6291(-)
MAPTLAQLVERLKGPISRGECTLTPEQLRKIEGLDNGNRQVMRDGEVLMKPGIKGTKGIGSFSKHTISAYIVLCNDILLITKKSIRSVDGTGLILLAEPLDLDQCTVSSVFYNDSCEFKIEECSKEGAGDEGKVSSASSLVGATTVTPSATTGEQKTTINTTGSSAPTHEKEQPRSTSPIPADATALVAQNTLSANTRIVLNSYVCRAKSRKDRGEWLKDIHNCILAAKGNSEQHQAAPLQHKLIQFQSKHSFTRRRSEKRLEEPLEEPHDRRFHLGLDDGAPSPTVSRSGSTKSTPGPSRQGSLLSKQGKQGAHGGTSATVSADADGQSSTSSTSIKVKKPVKFSTAIKPKSSPSDPSRAAQQPHHRLSASSTSSRLASSSLAKWQTLSNSASSASTASPASTMSSTRSGEQRYSPSVGDTKHSQQPRGRRAGSLSMARPPMRHAGGRYTNPSSPAAPSSTSASSSPRPASVNIMDSQRLSLAGLDEGAFNAEVPVLARFVEQVTRTRKGSGSSSGDPKDRRVAGIENGRSRRLIEQFERGRSSSLSSSSYIKQSELLHVKESKHRGEAYFKTVIQSSEDDRSLPMSPRRSNLTSPRHVLDSLVQEVEVSRYSPASSTAWGETAISAKLHRTDQDSEDDQDEEHQSPLHHDGNDMFNFASTGVETSLPSAHSTTSTSPPPPPPHGRRSTAVHPQLSSTSKADRKQYAMLHPQGDGEAGQSSKFREKILTLSSESEGEGDTELGLFQWDYDAPAVQPKRKPSWTRVTDMLSSKGKRSTNTMAASLSSDGDQQDARRTPLLKVVEACEATSQTSSPVPVSPTGGSPDDALDRLQGRSGSRISMQSDVSILSHHSADLDASALEKQLNETMALMGHQEEGSAASQDKDGTSAVGAGGKAKRPSMLSRMRANVAKRLGSKKSKFDEEGMVLDGEAIMRGSLRRPSKPRSASSAVTAISPEPTATMHAGMADSYGQTKKRSMRRLGSSSTIASNQGSYGGSIASWDAPVDTAIRSVSRAGVDRGTPTSMDLDGGMSDNVSTLSDVMMRAKDDVKRRPTYAFGSGSGSQDGAGEASSTARGQRDITSTFESDGAGMVGGVRLSMLFASPEETAFVETTSVMSGATSSSPLSNVSRRAARGSSTEGSWNDTDGGARTSSTFDSDRAARGSDHSLSHLDVEEMTPLELMAAKQHQKQRECQQKDHSLRVTLEGVDGTESMTDGAYSVQFNGLGGESVTDPTFKLSEYEVGESETDGGAVTFALQGACNTEVDCDAMPVLSLGSHAGESETDALQGQSLKLAGDSHTGESETDGGRVLALDGTCDTEVDCDAMPVLSLGSQAGESECDGAVIRVAGVDAGTSSTDQVLLRGLSIPDIDVDRARVTQRVLGVDASESTCDGEVDTNTPAALSSSEDEADSKKHQSKRERERSRRRSNPRAYPEHEFGSISRHLKLVDSERDGTSASSDRSGSPDFLSDGRSITPELKGKGHSLEHEKQKQKSKSKQKKTKASLLGLGLDFDDELKSFFEETDALCEEVAQREAEYRKEDIKRFRKANGQEEEQSRESGAKQDTFHRRKSLLLPVQNLIPEDRTLGMFLDTNWQQLMFPNDNNSDLLHITRIDEATQDIDDRVELLKVLRERQKLDVVQPKSSLPRVTDESSRQKWTGDLNIDVYGLNLQLQGTNSGVSTMDSIESAARRYGKLDTEDHVSPQDWQRHSKRVQQHRQSSKRKPARLDVPQSLLDVDVDDVVGTGAGMGVGDGVIEEQSHASGFDNLSAVMAGSTSTAATQSASDVDGVRRRASSRTRYRYDNIGHTEGHYDLSSSSDDGDDDGEDDGHAALAQRSDGNGSKLDGGNGDGVPGLGPPAHLPKGVATRGSLASWQANRFSHISAVSDQPSLPGLAARYSAEHLYETIPGEVDMFIPVRYNDGSTIEPDVEYMYTNGVTPLFPTDTVPTSIRWMEPEGSRLNKLNAFQLRLLSLYFGALGVESTTGCL